MKIKKFKLGLMQRKWVRALKSKKYKKAKGQLHKEKTNGYCCLGVANKCLNLNEKNEQTLFNTYKKLGLMDDDGKILDGYKFPRGCKTYKFLSDMNDCGVSHAKIAEFIEGNPELVFTKSV